MGIIIFFKFDQHRKLQYLQTAATTQVSLGGAGAGNNFNLSWWFYFWKTVNINGVSGKQLFITCGRA
jgi:hypothetical protein